LIKKAIIPAAGFGTRSLPITKVIPKEMFPIENKPSIQYVVEEAILAGIEQLLIVVSRSKNVILDYFDHSMELELFLQKAKKSALMEKVKLPDMQIFYTRQPFARGLGDAVRLGKEFVNGDPFAVLLPDDIVIGRGIVDLIEEFEQLKSPIVGLQEVDPARLHHYGVIQGVPVKENLCRVVKVVEKPKQNPPSNLALIGRYVLTPNIMEILETLPPDASGEIQLTDGINQMLAKDKCYGKIISGRRFDIGSGADYLALQNYLFNQKPNSQH